MAQPSADIFDQLLIDRLGHIRPPAAWIDYLDDEGVGQLAPFSAESFGAETRH